MAADLSSEAVITLRPSALKAARNSGPVTQGIPESEAGGGIPEALFHRGMRYAQPSGLKRAVRTEGHVRGSSVNCTGGDVQTAVRSRSVTRFGVGTEFRVYRSRVVKFGDLLPVRDQTLAVDRAGRCDPVSGGAGQTTREAHERSCAPASVAASRMRDEPSSAAVTSVPSAEADQVEPPVSVSGGGRPGRSRYPRQRWRRPRNLWPPSIRPTDVGAVMLPLTLMASPTERLATSRARLVMNSAALTHCRCAITRESRFW
jgi:hypothetical protein